MIAFAPNTLRVPSLALHGLSKDFIASRGETIHAVRELSLEIADQEMLAIVGPSASGKTTLLRLPIKAASHSEIEMSLALRRVDGM